jgi:hypothetical protein
MDHALEPHRQLAQRRRCANGEGRKELAGELQGAGPSKRLVWRLEECKGRAKWAAQEPPETRPMIEVLN